MSDFDFNLSVDGIGNPKIDFAIKDKKELNRLEPDILNRICLKYLAGRKAVVISTERKFGSKEIPVRCYGLYLPPMPNVWMPYYVRRGYRDPSNPEDEDQPSTVAPPIWMAVDKTLEEKDINYYKPIRRGIERNLCDLVRRLFTTSLSAQQNEQEDMHLLIVKLEGDPVSWHDFNLLLMLDGYMSNLRTPMCRSGMHLYISENLKETTQHIKPIQFKREFIRVAYEDREKKIGRRIEPDYLMGSTYNQTSVAIFHQVLDLGFLLA